MNVDFVCTYPKTMLDSIVFSASLPNLTSERPYSCVSSFSVRLSRWGPGNDVGFVETVSDP